MISRTHQGLVKRLFETEVPEIYDGTVTINAISREAGARTKMAVSSKDENVDAIGACIGPRGSRVNKIVELLGGEKDRHSQLQRRPQAVCCGCSRSRKRT